MQYLYAFIIGGLICGIAQIILDKTKITASRILVIFVVLGVVLTAVGLYKPLVDFAGAGATVPLTGFGYSLAEGVKKEIDENGAMGILTGGLKATAAGIAAVVIFGYIASMVAKPQIKE